MKTDEQAWQDKFAETEANLKRWWQEKGSATLTEIEAVVEAELGRLRQQLVEDLAHEVATKETDKGEPLCPACGTAMKRNGKKKRWLRTKADQVITLNREQMRCLQCGTTFFPPG
jgi:YgiT-type zinc finger domain-containing protein